MKIWTGIILVYIFLFSFQQKDKEITRMAPSSISYEVTSIDTLTLTIQDTIPNKTIKIYSDKNGYPIKYSRNIITGVCIDGECRMVAINLFWNTTGRYLGFKLPNGEFLSKTEHDPFNDNDYTRLHEILGETNSALASYTIDELVPKQDSFGLEVDAITSATIEDVLNYIVEGAVYTTHTLWHIVHGPSKHEIEKISTKRLNSELALIILNGDNNKDQVWVLNHISAEMEISDELQNKLLKLIAGNNIYLAERALNALKPKRITPEIQLELANVFTKSGFLLKRIIIQKFKASKTIEPEVIQQLSSMLLTLNGTLTKNVLDLYAFHNIADDYSVSEISQLLKSNNRYIANQAIHFLENVEPLDKKILKAINKYKKRNS